MPNILNARKQNQKLNSMNQHKGLVIWLTGLSASGKSTISKELFSALRNQKINSYILDGDVIRKGLCSDLGFSEKDRSENIRRIGEVAKILCEASVVCIVAFISPYRKDRDKVRQLMNNQNFVEVFVDCPLSVCEKRDPKGLYVKARKGEIPEFTGIASPYEPPIMPELHLKTDRSTVSECVETILQFLHHKSGLF